MLAQQLAASVQAQGAQGTRLCHLLSDESLLRRLCGNTGEDCISALRSLNLPDSFWTDEFKVVPCSKTYAHKWTLCPCAHIGETARRRCPRSVNYKAVLCPLVKAKKTCPLGDACSYAHNVFEHWLHPSRYKTRLCSFGRNCNRSICFFAHSAEELRCVPCSDDKEGDDREYLMQLLMAQENGLLPAPSLETMQPAAIPPLLSTMMPDMSSALQQALQQPGPPSARSSVFGMPDATAALMSARQSLNGVASVSDLMSARQSLSGLPADTGAALLRASMSGVADLQSNTPGGMLLRNRPSMNGLTERKAPTTYASTRMSMNGLPDGAVARTRPSLNGLPDVNATAATNMFQYMQRAVSSEFNSALNVANMQRAVSSDLGVSMGMAPSFHASAMQQALSCEMPSRPYNAATVAMERAFSRDISNGAICSGAAGIGTISSAQPAANEAMAAAALERMYPGMQPQSQRELLGRGGSRRGMSSMAQNHSMISVESDSLVQLRSSAVIAMGPIGGRSLGGPSGSFGNGVGARGYEATMGGPQAQARLSDPGTNNFHMAVAGGMANTAASQPRVSDSGNKLGNKDFHGLESLLPLVNSALSSGALPLQPTDASGDMRRSNSGMNNSGRLLSPPFQDPSSTGSPSHSGSLTPLSSNSIGEVCLVDGSGANMTASVAAAVAAAAGSPSRAIEGTAAFEGMYLAAASANSGGTQQSNHVASFGTMPQGSSAGVLPGVDQSYLTDLVARLQDQGVNKDQLVSSLSQLLAQLLSVQ